MSKVDILKELFRASVSSVQPDKLIQQIMRLNGRHLTVKNKTYEITKPVSIVGFGKAVSGMALAVERILGPFLERGILSVPVGSLGMEYLKRFDLRNSKIEFLEGAHNNLPDESAMRAASKIKDLAQNLEEDDVVIVLISGGGSALLPLPKDNITLSEKLDLIQKLAKRGANIVELNCVRKKLSELKGGGLAKFCYPAKVITLILSDVIGDPLDSIASGPTCRNNDKPDEALNILKKYNLYENLPVSIRETLLLSLKNQEDLDEKYFRNVDNFIIGNNQVATREMLRRCEDLKLNSFILSTKVNGDVEELGRSYLEITKSLVSYLSNEKTLEELVRELLALSSVRIPMEEDDLVEELKKLNIQRDICVILAGEPTVKVVGTGVGGRNQQLALSFSMKLYEFEDSSREIWFLSCGTDGIDGPTDAAGAVGYSGLRKDCAEEKLEPEIYLENNDCYSFFNKFNEGKYLVKVGHTGTNVMDVHLILIVKK